MRNSSSRQKGFIRRLEDLACVLLVYLFPILTGFIFFRVLHMGGAPSWWLFANGALFLASLGQAVYFLAAGIVPALKKALSRKPGREGRS